MVELLGEEWWGDGWGRLRKLRFGTSEGEEAMLGRHSKSGRNTKDRVSGAKARDQQKKKTHLQRSTATMGEGKLR